MDAVGGITTSTTAPASSSEPRVTVNAANAVNAYAQTVRSQAPSAARRVFEPPAIAPDQGRGGATTSQGGQTGTAPATTSSMLLPTLGEGGARGLFSLQIPRVDAASERPIQVRNATRTYSMNSFAIAKAAGAVSDGLATRMDMSI